MKTPTPALSVVIAKFLAFGPAWAADQTNAPVDVDITTASYPAGKPATIHGNGQLALMLNIPTVQRVVLAPEDVLDASLKVTLFNPPPAGTLGIYRAIHPDTTSPVAGTDYDSQPLATLSMGQFITNPNLPPGAKTAEVTGLGDLVRKSLTDRPSGQSLFFVIDGAQGNSAYNFAIGGTTLNIKIVSHPKAQLFCPSPPTSRWGLCPGP